MSKLTLRRDARLFHRITQLERLESRTLLAAHPIISEFMASNDQTQVDEDGNSSDWIEILNAGDMSVDLQGWYLTDNDQDLNKWQFPSTVLQPGESTIVFASGEDRDRFGQELHTNFKLSTNGEFLALVEPNGQTIASSFATRA